MISFDKLTTSQQSDVMDAIADKRIRITRDRHGAIDQVDFNGMLSPKPNAPILFAGDNLTQHIIKKRDYEHELARWNERFNEINS